ncbi:rhodanese-like domain-containing protein [Catellatospora bangladeshensis]|uniref:Sulfurtransferase n=1 Tax=Catellatospora bangladeshensis TaxID=310355 RepID=A0A8J3JE65_9ACTN|nr:rhodanese-like domain-containing protein [Catellatospora bangladeshensis]GIF82776.1 sulfurtransferase [Catellatospora bangladeshensis]
MSQSIDVVSTRALLAAGSEVLLLDVRTPAEFETAHLPGSVNVPLDQLDAYLPQLLAASGGDLILVCQSGNRAGQCQARLGAAGAAGSRVLSGGLNAWLAAGAPVVRGRQRWSLERQVRLVAGGITLAAIVVSVWLPPARYLAGFIGAGLTFAALTDTCAMGMLLAKLPYNRPRVTGGVPAAAAKLREHGSAR